MNNLKQYILEKLKINKDTKTSYAGDTVLMIINQTDRNSLDKTFPNPNGINCFLKVSKIKEVNDNTVIVPFYRKYGYSNESPQLLKFNLVNDEKSYFAKLDDSYDKDLHGVLLNKETALDYIRELIKSRKGVLKYNLDGKDYKIWKYGENPMYVYLQNIEQSLLD